MVYMNEWDQLGPTGRSGRPGGFGSPPIGGGPSEPGGITSPGGATAPPANRDFNAGDYTDLLHANDISLTNIPPDLRDLLNRFGIKGYWMWMDSRVARFGNGPPGTGYRGPTNASVGGGTMRAHSHGGHRGGVGGGSDDMYGDLMSMLMGP